MTTINFATRLIFAEDGTYPLTFSAIKARHPATSFAAEPSPEQLAELGYFVVEPTAAPSGDVVAEADPVKDEDGVYRQAYTVRAFSAEEVAGQFSVTQQTALQEVKRLRTAALEKGAPIDFGGDFGIQHVQLRDGDRANVLGLKVEAEEVIATGVPAATPHGLRTFENKFVPLTAEQMVAVSWKILTGFKVIMGSAWSLEDLISASEEVADLPTLPADLTPDVQALA